jgi:phage terminase large subunit-like protein
MIEDHRILHGDPVPDMRRIVVGVDPSGGSGPENDEQGIVVAGIGVDGEFYVLDDKSCKLSPHGWGSRAVGAFEQWGGDRIVAEKNYGGEMVLSTIKQVDSKVPVKLVSASRGKAVRAEPIAALYEQGKVHHVGSFPQLEDELTTWAPFDAAQKDSPNRLDALVWALTDLAFNGGQGRAFIEHWKRQTAPDPADTSATPVRSSARNWREIADQIKKERGGQPRTREDGHG